MVTVSVLLDGIKVDLPVVRLCGFHLNAISYVRTKASNPANVIRNYTLKIAVKSNRGQLVTIFPHF